MIARNLVHGEASLLYPRLDVIVNGQASYHLMECPVSVYLTSAIWKCLGGNIDIWGRVTSIAWSTLAVFLIFQLVAIWHDEWSGLGAAFVMSLSPVGIIYGQSFQLEASLPALTLTALLSLQYWHQSANRKWLLFFFLSTAFLFLTKIYMLSLLPLLVYLSVSPVLPKPGKDHSIHLPFPRNLYTNHKATFPLFALILSVSATALWYCLMARASGNNNLETAQHVYFSLQKTWDSHPFPHPLLHSPSFYKGLLDDLSGIVLTPIGFTFLFFALPHASDKRYQLWFSAAILLWIVMPRKFHEMNYYWMSILPFFCTQSGIGIAKVTRLLIKARRDYVRLLCVLIIVWFAFSIRYSLTPAFTTPLEDQSVLRAGNSVIRNTNKNDRIVTVHGSGIDLLYYCNRPGWALDLDAAVPDIENHLSETQGPFTAILKTYIQQGASHLIVADLAVLDKKPDFRKIVEELELVEKSGDFALYKLDDINTTSRTLKSTTD
jgi:4-amino-4-deoxy-L-arabinose transferase-like glycosyltransferase